MCCMTCRCVCVDSPVQYTTNQSCSAEFSREKRKIFSFSVKRETCLKTLSWSVLFVCKVILWSLSSHILMVSVQFFYFEWKSGNSRGVKIFHGIPIEFLRKANRNVLFSLSFQLSHIKLTRAATKTSTLTSVKWMRVVIWSSKSSKKLTQKRHALEKINLSWVILLNNQQQKRRRCRQRYTIVTCCSCCK